jgi:hypothetical protein
MTYHEFCFSFTNEYYELKSLYSNMSKINTGIKFKSSSGDITKGIKWIWASNKCTLNYFKRFFQSINLKEKLRSIFNSEFILRGASFIILEQSKVKDSEFHYDTFSRYDTEDTNILTIIFPLFKIDEKMGNLEFKNGLETDIYEYYPNKLVIWDSNKFLHRTQPYECDKPKKRVLVSVNLSTNEDWAVKTINNTLKHQGSELWVC